MFVNDLLGPHFYNNEFVHHVLYQFAFVIDAEHWNPVRKEQLRLREVVLDELNRRSFAQPGAPKRINIPLLKKRMSARSRELFGEKVVLELYLAKAWPSGL